MTISDSPYVIVGASLAGAKAAEALRAHGFAGPIVLIGSEAHRPYERPALSKDYLQGKVDQESIEVHPASWYADHDVQLRLSTTVTDLDPSQHQIILDGAERLNYAKLLLTTGSTPRRLSLPGADLDSVLSLRTVDDSDRIRAALAGSSRVVIIGGGWIGLETAAAARAAGAEVTVLEAGQLPLLRVLGPEIAQAFADLHRGQGVDLRCGVQITRLLGDQGKVSAVELADGTRIDADVVIVGVGISPNTALAEAAGLDVVNGILVDASLRTSDPDIFAAGDVANAFHPLLGKHLRMEHWATALNQPETAAKAMLDHDASYDSVPYFFTDQYDLGMEYAGYVEPGQYDQVVIRGDLKSQEYIAFWLSGNQVRAGMNVNIWDVTDDIQALIRARTPIRAEALADPDQPLTTLANSNASH